MNIVWDLSVIFPFHYMSIFTCEKLSKVVHVTLVLNFIAFSQRKNKWECYALVQFTLATLEVSGNIADQASPSIPLPAGIPNVCCKRCFLSGTLYVAS